MSRVEILSPAGSFEMLKSAVACGSDAVYLGAKEFSARRNAENFSDDELCEAVKYCHIRGVKVYLTLNIIIKDRELPLALETATHAYNAGIDGIIIADLGLAKILKEQLPTLPLHASTQLSVHSPSALKPLKDLGFCRVVVAREMSNEGLAEICREAKRLDLEIEAFVHGALCMCVSGQCLLSAFLGSRSGNRGLCAGPCRLPFSVENGTYYDLSLKDLSLINYTEQLMELGVSSFKIEGRMKRPEYVAAATAVFRKAVDERKIDTHLCDTLHKVFSRSGFTGGYFENRLGKDMFGIRTKEDVLSANDAFPLIHELYRKERQSVALTLKAEFKKEKASCLIVSDGENTVKVFGDIPQAAKNKPTSSEDVAKNLLKFGSTPYYAKSYDIALDEGLFIPASALNALRRQGAEQLDKIRSEKNIKNALTSFSPLPEATQPSKGQKIYIRVQSISQLPDNLDGIDAVIVPCESDFSCIKAGVRYIADIPRGISSEKTVRELLLKLKDKGITTALCGNLAAFTLAKELGFEVIADSSMNIINSYSISTTADLGAKEIILSNEITLTDAEKISSALPKGIVAYGNTPLMLFKNCPIKNGKDCKACDKRGVITDRKGISFPIRCRMGFSEMLNSVPVWLADRKNEYAFLDFIVLYFTDENRERVGEVINAYKNGNSPDIKYTRGLFYRGSI